MTWRSKFWESKWKRDRKSAWTLDQAQLWFDKCIWAVRKRVCGKDRCPSNLDFQSWKSHQRSYLFSRTTNWRKRKSSKFLTQKRGWCNLAVRKHQEASYRNQRTISNSWQSIKRNEAKLNNNQASWVLARLKRGRTWGNEIEEF